MLLAFLALALTSHQQAEHDKAEWKMYQHLESYRDALDFLWQPNAELYRDYHSAQECYTKFHLYKATSCDAEFAIVDRAFKEAEAADKAGR